MDRFVEENKKGDAVIAASPRIYQASKKDYGWASSPSHIGQSPNLESE